ncbi:MAG: hypothetical protein KKB09_07185 [Nanoarchaeota archaeon]|nr:hypothetical protein [Nanoarchaeota archaeon]
MDKKTLVWNTIRDFNITSYTTLWFKFIKTIPNITAQELDNILLELNKEQKIILSAPESDDAIFLYEKKKIIFVGQWVIKSDFVKEVLL